MKKQLNDVCGDKETHYIETKTQDDEVERKNEEKNESQTQADISSKVDTFDTEISLLQETMSLMQHNDATQSLSELNDKCEKALVELAQAKTRVMVVQEENKRLSLQVAALLEDKCQHDCAMQVLVEKNEYLQRRMTDLMQQLREARQSQQDMETMKCVRTSTSNYAFDDNDELKNMTEQKDVSEDVVCARELETTIPNGKAGRAASDKNWELEKQQLTQQIESLMSTSEKASAELLSVAQIREQLLVHVGIDLTYENIKSLFDKKSNEIQMLTKQLSTIDRSQKQATCEDTIAGEAETLRFQLKTLQTQYDWEATEKIERDKTIEKLRSDLERAAEDNSFLHLDTEFECRHNCEALVEAEHLRKQLMNAQTEKQQLVANFSAISSKIKTLVWQVEKPAFADVGDNASHYVQLAELEKHLAYIQEQLVIAAKLSQRQGEAEDLQGRIHRYEVENTLMSAKLEECEFALKAHATTFAVRGLDAIYDDNAVSVLSNDETGEACNGNSPDLERELQLTRAQLHAVEAEMTACKAENLRMTFEVAKAVDNVSKLKQDHEALLETHREKSLELQTMIVQFMSLESTTQRLESDLASKSNDLRCHLEAFAMQREDYQSIIADLNINAKNKYTKIKRVVEDIKSENDILEERISELLAIADSKTEVDERQDKDLEVEELRSSLVQVKANFLEQKQQLSALEKKLVVVSKLGGSICTVNSALDAERKEFEAALIEMIEMEKKLQVAYETKQSLESALQERTEANVELEYRLSVADDKIADLEHQLEQKVALIATIEEQLRSVEVEREKLADEFAKTKLKLERSRGKLEEKAIELEAFKTTTSMLKDERTRLFNEIALLKDNIAKSEVQKAAMADSQELAHEELEDQLNELADKIAEIEAEKQDLCARLEDTVYRSEEDIHQLRERLYMVEGEKSGIDSENLNLARTVGDLKVKVDILEEQKVNLELSHESSCHQLTLLEDQLEKAASNIATLFVEKNSLIDLQQSLEANLAASQDEKVEMEQIAEETISKLREEREQVTIQVGALQIQLTQCAAEKKELSVALSEFRERSEKEKVVYEEATAKLEFQLSENRSLENKIRALKQMAEKAVLSVQATRTELSEAELRTGVVVKERDTAIALLRNEESVNKMLTIQCEDLQQQVNKLSNAFEILERKQLDEADAAKETVRRLTASEAKLTESLELLRKELAEAESCTMVLVDERDEARRDLTSKDIKIEMMMSQQGELNLVAEKLEKELKILRGKSVAEAKATQETIHNLKKSITATEKRADDLKDLLYQAEKSLQSIQVQLTESELHVMALEKERDAMRSSVNGKELTHDTLNTLQENLQTKVDVLELELKELRESSSAELAAANEIIGRLQIAGADEAEKLAYLRQELAEVEGCVLVLVEERDAAKKTLSKRELTLEVLSSEHGELQLKSQSMTTELDALRKKTVAEARSAEITVQALKEEVRFAAKSLQLAQEQLAESELRVASLTAECEDASKALSDQKHERKAMQSHKKELMFCIKDLETKIENMETRHAAMLKSSDEGIDMLKTSETELKESLELARTELSQVVSRSESLALKCDSLRDVLDEKEVIISCSTNQVDICQKRIQTLMIELQEQRSQHESDTLTSEQTICSLKESESETAEMLKAIRHELAETQARVVSVEEERVAACKALSELESQREAQSAEATSLHERIQSLEIELQEQRSQHESDTLTSEQTICSLKESESETAEMLKAIRHELAETQARVVSVEEERVAACKALSELESQREAQSAEATSLHERIQSLEIELQEQRSQHESDTLTSEQTICSLKESESETAEMLKAIRHELAETQARVVSVEEERVAACKALSELESQREAQSAEATSLHERIQSLEIELQEQRSQHESDTLTSEQTICSLKESESETAEMLKAIRHELAETQARVVSVEEERVAACKALSELESQREAQSAEATSLHERIQSLEIELQEQRSQHESDTLTSEQTICSLKESESETAEMLKAIRHELAETQARVVSVEEERVAACKALSELESQREAQSAEATSLHERIQSLEIELQEQRSQHESDTLTSEQTICSLKESESETAEMLKAIRHELAETQARVVSVEEERVAACKALSELESQREAQSAEATSLHERIQSLEIELQEQRSQHESDTLTSEQTICSLKESESETAEMLKAIRHELAETQARVVSVEEERVAACKALSELESQREAQSAEATSLHERIQSLEIELQEQRSQHESDTLTSEQTICSLKESESETAEMLKAIRHELAETQARVVSVEEERVAACKALSELESQREAQSAEATSLHERIQSLEIELQEQRSQHESDTLTSEQTICSLKESESETAEMLKAIRHELAETQARVVSVEEEHNMVGDGVKRKENEVELLRKEKVAQLDKGQFSDDSISELGYEPEERSLILLNGSQKSQKLGHQVVPIEMQLDNQSRASEATLVKEMEIVKDQVTLLSVTSSAAVKESSVDCKQKAFEDDSYAADIARKEEVISTLKSKLVEVMAAYKRLKGHLQKLQDRLARQASTHDDLKTSYDELNAQHSACIMKLNALQLKFAVSCEQAAAQAEALRRADEKGVQYEIEIEHLNERVLAYDETIAQMQRQHDVVLHDQKTNAVVAFVASEEAANWKVAELEKSSMALTESVEQKELTIQSLTEHLQAIEQRQAQAESDHEESARKYEAERNELLAQLSVANATIEKLGSAADADVGLQRDAMSQLKKQIAELELQVEAKTEEVNAARAALGTYKRRAHIALKKTSSENKWNMKKAVESTMKLEDEVLSAQSQISLLETELEKAQRRIQEAESAGDAVTQKLRKTQEADKRSQEIALQLEIDRLKVEVIQLKEGLDGAKVSHESQIKQLTEHNRALTYEISSLEEVARTQHAAAEQTAIAKEQVIYDLSKQLHTAVAALGTNKSELDRSCSPPSSPIGKEKCSMASSSLRSYDVESLNGLLENRQDEHIAAAVEDLCPIPLASKVTAANCVEQHSKTSDDEVVNLKLLLNEVESKSRAFQKKYEDASALLEETNRQKQHLDDRSSLDLNFQYLRNVIIKYMESQVPAEKEQLVSVLATLLDFSIQERHQVLFAHNRANEESAGFFHGVFSLFGSTAATTSSPKQVVAPPNVKSSSVTSNPLGAAIGSKDKSGILTFGSDPSDDEDFGMSLNPFAA